MHPDIILYPEIEIKQKKKKKKKSWESAYLPKFGDTGRSFDLPFFLLLFHKQCLLSHMIFTGIFTTELIYHSTFYVTWNNAFVCLIIYLFLIMYPMMSVP